MRKPAVAGYFYPSEKKELKEMVESFLSSEVVVSAVGGISPHAGYIYSGRIAGITFSSIKELRNAESVVFLGPNHTGYGSPLAVSLEDWETPLGVVETDRELAMKIIDASPYIVHDELAHFREHSIEVQIPFLQLLNPNAKIVALSMMAQDYEAAKEVANALLTSLPRDAVVIASSDFSHYVSEEEARKKDTLAFEYIKRGDAKIFEENVERHGWSICGHGPITALMLYAKERNSKARKIAYTTSAERTGDRFNVVGYMSVVFENE